jgi:hypothetical protein
VFLFQLVLLHMSKVKPFQNVMSNGKGPLMMQKAPCDVQYSKLTGLSQTNNPYPRNPLPVLERSSIVLLLADMID